MPKTVLFLLLAVFSAQLPASISSANSDCGKKLSPTGAISAEWVKKAGAEASRELTEQPTLKRLQDGAQTLGMKDVAKNSEIIKQHTSAYTHELKRGVINNQMQSGRCWLFAGCAMVRDSLIGNKKVAPDFNFSESYFYFFNMLEKSNYYLNKVINTHGEKLSRKALRKVMNPAGPGNIADGGFFEYFEQLVEKYGMVPREAMPDTKSAQNTALLVEDLRNEAGRTAIELRHKIEEFQKVSPQLTDAQLQSLYDIKNESMKRVYKILVAHLGNPPQEFEYRSTDLADTKKADEAKDNPLQVKPATVKRFTPKSFAQDFVGFKPDEYVIVSSVPILEQDRYFRVKGLVNAVTSPGERSFETKFLNLSPERMLELTTGSIDAGQAVWFAADIGKSGDRASGILHPELYQTSTVYGLDGQNTSGVQALRDQFFLKLTDATHAMVFTAYDRPNANGPVVKLKVENSWGVENGDKGIYHMYSEWFRKSVFQVIIKRDLLSEKEKALLSSKPKTITKDQYFDE